MALAPVFEKLLTGWRAQGYELVATQTIAGQLGPQDVAHATP